MTNEVAIRPSEQMATSQRITDVQRVGGLLAASGYFTDAREMAQAAVKVMAGEELGIPPVASMMGINIIKGKIALGANLIASRIRAHGYEYRHKQFDATGCTLVFFSKLQKSGEREVLGESSFTDADAKAAQIVSDMYKKYPRNMFFSRAMSNGARWFCPEVFAGAPVYVPEELGAAVDDQGDMVIEPPPMPTPQQVAQSKIVQMQAGVPYAETVVPKVDQPQAQQGEQVPDEVSIMWSEMRSIASVCEVFKVLKGQLVATMGGSAGEAEYYRILWSVGKAKHANELKQRAGRQTAYEMWKAVQQAKSLGVDPGDVQITDEDLPAEFRQQGGAE